SLIAEYCQVATVPRTTERLPSRQVVRSVALFALLDLPQCRFYRIDQKIEQLKHAGFDVTLFDANSDLAAFLGRIVEFQAVIFYRLAPLPNVIPAIQAANALGLVTFYEIDDLLFMPDEYPGDFEGYAGQISREVFNM